MCLIVCHSSFFRLARNLKSTVILFSVFRSGSTPNRFYIFQRLIEQNNFEIAYYTENSGAAAKPREVISNLGYQVNIPQGFSPVFDAANSGKKYFDKI